MDSREPSALGEMEWVHHRAQQLLPAWIGKLTVVQVVNVPAVTVSAQWPLTPGHQIREFRGTVRAPIGELVLPNQRLQRIREAMVALSLAFLAFSVTPGPQQFRTLRPAHEAVKTRIHRDDGCAERIL